MHTHKQYKAVMGIGVVSIPNPNRDGSGSMVNILTGSGDGTIIKTITIKAIASTTQGMVRFFIKPVASASQFIYREIQVLATTQTGVQPSFMSKIGSGYTLAAGESIWASTQNAETFNILIEGSVITNCPCA